MPITVTVNRGTPLPTPVAVLFTVIGAALIVLGFTVIPGVPQMDASTYVLYVVAGLLVIPAWIIFFVVVAKRLATRSDDAVAVPDEIREPPSNDDVAVVATLLVNGAGLEGRAVAGTVLALADRGVISINEFGERIVISIPPDATGDTPDEQLVLDGLRAEAGPDGDVVGPPIWNDEPRWWRAYATAVRTRAIAAGLVETRLPYVGLMVLFIFTAVAFSLVFFWRIPVFIGTILLANGAPHLLARASGYRLTDAGREQRARWLAFGRFLRVHETVGAVGPAGVSVWGPNLVYGSVLGAADRAARPLTPDVGREPTDHGEAIMTKTIEL